MFGQVAPQRLVVDGGELRAGERAAFDAQLAADRGRGHGVVAGDHAHLDAGALALGDRVAASGRGGSTMPTIASSVRSLTSASSSPLGSKVAGSKSRRATTITRSPALAMRSFSSSASWRFSSVIGDVVAFRHPDVAAAGDQHVGRALDEAAHDRLACSSVMSWNVAMNLYSESNGTSATRG